jgi:signal transduction histidine kinase
MIDTCFAPSQRTERREFENQIENISHNRIMDTILKTISGVLVILNEDRQLVAVNHAFLEAIGAADPEKVLGLRLGESLACIHAEEAPNGCGTTPYCITCGAAIAMMTAINDDRSDEQVCALTVEKDGQKRDLSLLIQAQPVKVDNHRWILIFAQDITKQQFWINLEHIFFHDINNLLTSLRGVSYLHLMNSSGNNDAKMIHDLVERLCSEISMQSSLAQHRDDRYLLGKSEVSLKEIKNYLDLAIGTHKSLAGKNIFEEWPVEDIKIHSDRLLISRVLGNMIINALEATPEGGSVRVSTKIEKDSIVWEVWNDVFIDEDIQKRIFQRHFSTKSSYGRGLGTYSMKIFGEDYLKGNISFKSSRESGTSFVFSLPR